MTNFTATVVTILMFFTVYGLLMLPNLIVFNNFKTKKTTRKLVTGKVRKEVRGGFAVKVSGITCFCPSSHISLRKADPKQFIGKTLQFHVLQTSLNRIVLSRKELLNAQRKQTLDEYKEHTGSMVTGIITDIKDFGAFVAIGQETALIPASELSWAPKARPHDIFHKGDKVTAKILTADSETGRIALSLKAMSQDPMTTIKPGNEFTGPIVKVQDYGAFQQIAPGITGLIHNSNRQGLPIPKLGEIVSTQVLSVDQQRRRISLQLTP